MALSLLNAKKPRLLQHLTNIQSFQLTQRFLSKMANGPVSSIPTAGVIVIGNEILHGEVQDTNSHFIASKLYKLGIKLCKISVVADDVEMISNEVLTFSKLYTHVITTGGIGPTHDDITFEGVANAFKEDLKQNMEIVHLIQNWFKTDDMNSPAMKMACIPESSQLHFGINKENGLKSNYPIVSVKNIFMFPGIPKLLQRSFDNLAETLFLNPGLQFNYGCIYLDEGEVYLAPVLDETLKRFPDVSIGSYPELFHSYYKTKITMNSLVPKSIEDAKNFIISKVNKDSIVNYNADTISEPWVQIEELCRNCTELAIKIEDAQSCLRSCFDKYDVDEICLCYNGGKDCSVVLHLTHAIMLKNYPGKKLQAVYIPEKNPFPQLEEFIHQNIKRYELDCEIIPGPIKSGLSELLRKNPNIKAVIMGTRRGDPRSDNLSYFSPTDNDWPNIMRVNSIIDWDYSNVWKFLRGLCLPYCQLYDRGYTSIGGQDNTLPNQFLQIKGSEDRISYLPAYRLVDAQHERKGRLS